MDFTVVAFLLLLNGNNAQKEPVKMTLLSIYHFKSEVDSHYQCYLSDDDSNKDDITMESMRTGWTRDTADENPDPPSPIWDNQMYKHYEVTMPNNDKNDAFGVFGCKATKDGKLDTSISTTRMRSDADIVPTNELFTKTVNINDTGVTISMKRSFGTDVFPFRWRHSNSTTMWHGSSTFLIDRPVQLDDSGIYECHMQGKRSEAKHGLSLLIVRACPAFRWNPPGCDGVCDSCYNGGICDENNGKCICPPGFRGDNCLQVCGSNKFGHSCDKKCSKNEGDNKCSKYLFCLPHPFGCRCNTGFKGLDCDLDCDPGTFGASCLMSCHCTSDQCDKFTGRCTEGETCTVGWTGDNCQECEGNVFGPECSSECHCYKDTCNVESGLCKAGGCLPQWVDLYPPHSCQTGLTNITYVRKNPGIEVPVTCTAVQGPGGDLNDFGLYLSRHPNNLESDNISRTEDILDDGTTRTQTFNVKGVEDEDKFYCQLRNESKGLAFLGPLDIHAFELPKLSLPPVNERVNGTSITISWSAWDEENDEGDPPVVGYIPYYKKTVESTWTPSNMTSPDTLMFTADGLDPETKYSFSVSAVREGEGGEGPKGEELYVSTMCDVPPSPRNVTTSIFGEHQELVVIFWEVPSEKIACSSGITKFTLYYDSSETEFNSVDIDSRARSYILHDLTVGMSYTFYVTLSTSGGESDESNHAEHLVPVLPTLAQPPLLTDVTCHSITIVWDKWTEETDSGTPPVIYYIPYHRVSDSSDWTSHENVPHRDVEEKYGFIFNNLAASSSYEFCVVAVREGYGGEGDKNNIIQGKTDTCKGIEAYIVAISVIAPVAMIFIIIAVVFTFLRYRRTLSEQRPHGEPVEATYENEAFGDTNDYSTISKDHFESQLTMYQGLQTIGSTKMTCNENPEKDNDAGYEVPVPSSSSSNIQFSSETRGNVEDDKGSAQDQYEDLDSSTAKSNVYVNIKGESKPH